MPLERTTTEVLLKGLAQKSSEATRPGNQLTEAINVEFDKDGQLNKCRGYRYVSPDNTVNRFDDDAVMIHVATLRQELVVFTYDYIASLVSPAAALRGTDSLVYRGPNNRGNGKVKLISASQNTHEDPDDP